MGSVIAIGLDRAKNVFQVHGIDAEGAAVKAGAYWLIVRGTMPKGCPSHQRSFVHKGAVAIQADAERWSCKA